MYWTQTNKMYKMLDRAGYSRIDIKNMFSIRRNEDVQKFFENPKDWTLRQVELFTWACRQSSSFKSLTLKDVWEILSFGKPTKDMTQAEMNVYIARKMWLKGNANQ